jgi:small neutral amino acid transporter SnatA (MarC family)
VSAFLALVAAVNPLAVAATLRDREQRRVVAVAAGGASAVAVALAWLSAPLLDALDVTPATFRVAAAVVLGAASLRWLVAGSRRLSGDAPGDGGWDRLLVPLLVPVLLTPQLVAVSISVGADDGVAAVVLGAIVAMVLAWAAATTRTAGEAWSAGSRFVGMVGVVVAFGMIVDGVRSV